MFSGEIYAFTITAPLYSHGVCVSKYLFITFTNRQQTRPTPARPPRKVKHVYILSSKSIWIANQPTPQPKKTKLIGYHKLIFIHGWRKGSSRPVCDYRDKWGGLFRQPGLLSRSSPQKHPQCCSPRCKPALLLVHYPAQWRAAATDPPPVFNQPCESLMTPSMRLLCSDSCSAGWYGWNHY